jgi:hypothetical protein
MINSEHTNGGTFEEFKSFTLAVARGEKKVGPNEPRIWVDCRGENGGDGAQQP